MRLDRTKRPGGPLLTPLGPPLRLVCTFPAATTCYLLNDILEAGGRDACTCDWEGSGARYWVESALLFITVLTIAAAPNVVVAQEGAVALAPGDDLLEIELGDGSVLFVRVAEIAGETIVLVTLGGTRIEVKRTQIQGVSLAEGHVVNGQFLGEDPNLLRLFFTATGRTLEQAVRAASSLRRTTSYRANAGSCSPEGCASSAGVSQWTWQWQVSRKRTAVIAASRCSISHKPSGTVGEVRVGSFGVAVLWGTHVRRPRVPR